MTFAEINGIYYEIYMNHTNIQCDKMQCLLSYSKWYIQVALKSKSYTQASEDQCGVYCVFLKLVVIYDKYAGITNANIFRCVVTLMTLA